METVSSGNYLNHTTQQWYSIERKQTKFIFKVKNANHQSIFGAELDLNGNVYRVKGGLKLSLIQKVFSKVLDVSESNSKREVELECPIGFNVMEDPVRDDCGHTFDRKNISRWLLTDSRCPISRQVITNLTPDVEKASDIQKGASPLHRAFSHVAKGELSEGIEVLMGNESQEAFDLILPLLLLSGRTSEAFERVARIQEIEDFSEEDVSRDLERSFLKFHRSKDHKDLWEIPIKISRLSGLVIQRCGSTCGSVVDIYEMRLKRARQTIAI